MKRTLTSKFLAIILSAAMVFGSCGFVAQTYADTTNEVGTFNGFSVVENTIELGDNWHKNTYKAEYYYSDGFFTQSATVENTHLYNTMIVASRAATMSGAYSLPTTILSLFSTLGYEGVVANSEYSSTPTEDSIGVASAYKKVTDGKDEFYVVPVVIRGGGYGAEWKGNAVIGSSGNAKNFQAAAEKAVAFTKDNVVSKIKAQKGDGVKIKFWVTGYSRGASVANIAAKILTDEYCQDDVYGYAFEPARTTTDDEETVCSQYKNIRAIVYEDDLVTYLPPAAYNFRWYGQTVTLSNSEADMEAVNAQTQILDPGNTYVADDAEFGEYTIDLDFDNLLSLAWDAITGDLDASPQPTNRAVTQSAWLTETMQTIVTDWNLFGTRANYSTAAYENGSTTTEHGTAEYTVKTVLDICMNSDLDGLQGVLNQLVKDVKNDWTTLASYVTPAKTMLQGGPDALHWDDTYKKNIWGKTVVDEIGRKSTYDYAWGLFSDAYTTYCKENETAPLTTEQYNALYNCRYTLFKIALNFVYHDFADGHATVLGTFVECGETIIDDHQPVKIMGFLRAKDNYYVQSTAAMTKVAGTKATTTAAGTIDTWKDAAGRIYADEDGYNEVTSDHLTVARIDESSITLSQDVYESSVAVEDRKPTVTVKDKVDNTLKQGTDYDVKYSNYDKLGEATATITFKGNYQGTVTKNYRIGKGYIVSGTISGAKTISYKLTKDSAIYAEGTATGGEYSFTADCTGECVLTITADGCVTRTYNINLTGDTTQNIKLAQLGDVDYSGKLSAADVTAIARHLAGIKTFDDDYQSILMDVDKNGEYQAADVTRLARFLANIIPSL